MCVRHAVLGGSAVGEWMGSRKLLGSRALGTLWSPPQARCEPTAATVPTACTNPAACILLPLLLMGGCSLDTAQPVVGHCYSCRVVSHHKGAAWFRCNVPPPSRAHHATTGSQAM
jgi:hypothetical protein